VTVRAIGNLTGRVIDKCLVSADAAVFAARIGADCIQELPWLRVAF
jgi:hypothetical protein